MASTSPCAWWKEPGIWLPQSQASFGLFPLLGHLSWWELVGSFVTVRLLLKAGPRTEGG